MSYSPCPVGVALDVLESNTDSVPLRGKAVEVLIHFLDDALGAVAGTPESGDEFGAGDGSPAVTGAHGNPVAGFAADPAAPPLVAGVTPVGSADDDGRWFAGKNLKLIRDARRRAKAQLVAAGWAPEVAERKVSAVSPALILALILQYGPDLVRIVREIVDRLRNG